VQQSQVQHRLHLARQEVGRIDLDLLQLTVLVYKTIARRKQFETFSNESLGILA